MKNDNQNVFHLHRFSEEFTLEQQATEDALAAALAVLKFRGVRAEVTVKVLGGREVSRDNF